VISRCEEANTLVDCVSIVPGNRRSAVQSGVWAAVRVDKSDGRKG
jgi:hypothetical protein